MSRKLPLFIFSLLIITSFSCGVFVFLKDKKQKTNRQVIIGVARDYSPFSFQDEDRVITGFDVEMMRKIFADSEREVRFEVMNISELINAVETRKVDLAVSGISIDRKVSPSIEKIEYEAIFASNFPCFMALKGSTKKINEARKIGVRSGTSEEDILETRRNLIRKGAVEIVKLDKKENMIYDLKHGLIDFVFLPRYQFLEINELEKDVFSCELFKKSKFQSKNPVKNYAILVHKKSPKIKKETQDKLEKIKANGEYDLLRLEWISGGNEEDEEE